MPPKKSNHKTKASFDDIFDTQLNIDKLIEKAKKQGKSKIKIKIDGKEIEINLKENKDTIWNKILKITLGTAAAAGAGALAYYGYKNKDDLMKAVKDYYNNGKTGAKKLGADISKFATDKYKVAKDYATDKYNLAKDYATDKYNQVKDYFYPKNALLPYYDNPRETYNNDTFTPEYKIPLDYIKPGIIRDKIKLETGTDLIPYNPNSYDIHGPEYIPPKSLNQLRDQLFDIKSYVDKSSDTTPIDSSLLNRMVSEIGHRYQNYPWDYMKISQALANIIYNGRLLDLEQSDDFGSESNVRTYKDNIYNGLDALEYIINHPNRN